MSGKPATSYHPAGEDGKTPGEQALNEIYKALKAGPKLERTLLIITFDKHGGLFDHVPPPYADNPWPNNVNDGFQLRPDGRTSADHTRVTVDQRTDRVPLTHGSTLRLDIDPQRPC